MNKEMWKNPIAYTELENAEVPLWFWNDKLENEELIRQLELQTSVGTTGTTPHVRMNGGNGYIGGFLDEDWFEKIRLVLEYKKEHNEKFWLYDEIDWPSGTCNRTVTKDENFREQYLDIKKIEIPKDGYFRMQVKNITKQNLLNVNDMESLRQYPVNVYLVDRNHNQVVDPYEYMFSSPFGIELELDRNNHLDLYEITIRVDTYIGGGDQQVNYMNKSATEKFIELSYEPYKREVGEYLGNIINTSFNDETRMCNPLPWSQDFADEFLKRKGYSIYPVLIHLILSGEEAGRTKCDYYDVLASLYQENYFHTLQTWCENHGISFCAHLLGEETLHGHTRFSGDYLRQNRYLDIPGADHLGKGIGSLNLKFTSTGAHSYGKDMTAVEMFAGAGLDLTYDEYIRMVTWAFQCGMKCIVNHGFSYSLRGDRINDWPPSQFFQWVGWEHMKEGNEMIRRLHYALTGGKSEEQILVYHPLESFWLHYEPDLNYTYAYHKGPITKSEKAADIDQGMQVLLNRLLEENKGFEMIHKDALDNFVVKGKQIENVVMNQQFDVLILPYCQVLSIEMLMKCLAFASHGGKIFIFSEIPTYAMKKEDDEKLVALTKQLMEYESVVFLERTEEDALFSEIENSIQPPLKVVEGIGKNKNNRPTYERRLQDPYMHHGEDLSGVMYVHYKKGNLRNTVFMNYDEMETEVIVEVESLSIPELWDTMTGEVKIPEHEKIGEMIYRCKFILPVGYGIILQSHYVK